MEMLQILVIGYPPIYRHYITAILCRCLKENSNSLQIIIVKYTYLCLSVQTIRKQLLIRLGTASPIVQHVSLVIKEPQTQYCSEVLKETVLRNVRLSYGQPSFNYDKIMKSLNNGSGKFWLSVIFHGNWENFFVLQVLQLHC